MNYKSEKRKEILYYIVLILFTFTVGYISFGKGFDFETYHGFSGDGYGLLAYIKGIQENGFMGSLFNSRLGAPDTATLLDYPFAGNTMILIIWVISCFIKSTTVIAYVYLLVTFILNGISMSILLRKLQINREISFVLSALFSFAPYHFYRYLGHGTLSEYAEIPLAIYLSLYIIGNISQTKKWKLVVMAILLGLGYGYYYAFGLILLSVAYIIKLVKVKHKKDIFKDLWIISIVLLTIFVMFIPKLSYSLINGGNLEAGHRRWFEQEYYGLKIINMLLPVSYSKIEALRELTEEYALKAPLVTENEMANLGFIASIGFIVLCVSLIISFINKKKCVGKDWEVIDYLSLSTLALILMSTVGGFGEIFNWAVTSQIRCYNRVSIVITALALTMIALLINKITKKSKCASYVTSILILCLGMFDQVRILNANWQDIFKSTQIMYENFFTEVEDNLSAEAMIYQLPYMDYPEAGSINNINDYEHLTGYLFTDRLKWSYGGVRGRDLSAKELNIDSGMSFTFLYKIKEAGFEAVYIDLDGYSDGGESILTFYNSLGVKPIISEDKKLYVYDISDIYISEKWLVPGFSLLYIWAYENNIKISDNELITIANGLVNMEPDAFSKIYHWFTNNSIVSNGTNEEYVKFLFNKLLNRNVSSEDIESWISALENGANRESIFSSFLRCSEFRMKQGYEPTK